jgi:molybdopterin-containing oxidoreductase family iron-sulfur binding subunit
VRSPEEIVPGKPLFFATAMPIGGMAQGVLVESHMGRPTKIEGNPDHPASLGATQVLAQASILTLYDPDRSQTITHLGEISSSSAFIGEIRERMVAQRSSQGASFRVLTETITSPTLARQLRELLKEFPEATWHQYDPAGRDNVKEGSRRCFGQLVETRYRLERAQVILALDADFLSSLPGSVRYTHDFSAGRRVRETQQMNRLYAVESTPSLTGAKADHRWPLRAREIERFARTLAKAVGVDAEIGGPFDSSFDSQSLAALAKDLKTHRGHSLVIPGDEQPAEVHVLAHAMNHALGNVGETVIYTDPVEANPITQIESLRELVRDMEAGKVDLLVILGGNPVYNAPVDLRFSECLEKVRLRIHLSLFEDETSALCHWHVPETHFLESWGDLRAYDGTVSIVQPLIMPLYDGKSSHELLAALAGQPDRSRI